jgi:hypothetical protein
MNGWKTRTTVREKRILDAALRRFPPNNADGVIGFDVGPRIQAGLETRETTLRVYVERKAPRPRAAPTLTFVDGGRRRVLRADVIATGERPGASAGSAKPFSGLHQGAAIVVASKRYGGVGVLVGVGGEPVAFVTAGHLFKAGAVRTTVEAARLEGGRKIVGFLAKNLLDELADDQEFPIDAALVRLTDAGKAMAKATRNARAPRPSALLDPDAADRVQAFRPTTHDYSAASDVVLAPSVAHFSAPARPDGYSVREVVRTAQHVTKAGDSGTLFVAADDDRGALGTCIGGDGRSSFIEPLSRSLAFFCATTGDDLLICNGERPLIDSACFSRCSFAP